ncbi:MAG: hypothetical protein HIU90_07955 [Proteobacteria bacterium]|nr:hypothetical protein [Pseudomonadota bacterium]
MPKRRRVTLGLGGFVWLASTRALLAETLESPQAAGYTDQHGTDGDVCAACQFFRPDHAAPARAGRCQLVAGPIMPTGHCYFYARR